MTRYLHAAVSIHCSAHGCLQRVSALINSRVVNFTDPVVDDCFLARVRRVLHFGLLPFRQKAQ